MFVLVVPLHVVPRPPIPATGNLAAHPDRPTGMMRAALFVGLLTVVGSLGCGADDGPQVAAG
jgi:hypothetical protein